MNGLSSMKRHLMRSFLMMVGIIVGITALTLIFSLSKGVEKQIMKRVEKFGLSSLMIRTGGGREMGMPLSGTISTMKLSDLTAIENEVSNIKGMAPMLPGRQEIKYMENTATAMVFGVTPAYDFVWNWGVTNGEFIDESDISSSSRVALLGPTVLAELFGENDPLGEQIRIGNVSFTVKGVLVSKGTSPGGGDMDNRILIPLTTSMRRLMNVDYISMAKVLLKDYKKMDQTVSQISEILREQHHLTGDEPDDFRVITPTHVTEFASEVYGTFNVFLLLVAGISLLVGGIVVANLMLISVNERTGEIGLRKAVGARSKDILLQFLSETTVIAIAGGVIGIVLGLLGAKSLNIIMELPAAISWEAPVLGVLFSTVVGIISGVQPARRAAALDPVDTLR